VCCTGKYCPKLYGLIFRWRGDCLHSDKRDGREFALQTPEGRVSCQNIYCAASRWWQVKPKAYDWNLVYTNRKKQYFCDESEERSWNLKRTKIITPQPMPYTYM
jgi:hypothetical protein